MSIRRNAVPRFGRKRKFTYGNTDQVSKRTMSQGETGPPSERQLTISESRINQPCKAIIKSE